MHALKFNFCRIAGGDAHRTQHGKRVPVCGLGYQVKPFSNKRIRNTTSTWLTSGKTLKISQIFQVPTFLRANHGTKIRRRVTKCATRGWEFWIDRGGTFTDVVASRPDGELVTMKLLSENPESYPDAAVHAIRTFLGVGPGEHIPADNIDFVKMGTTVATNALLERKGEDTLLLITKGFGDALRIAYQNRPRLFDREIVLPELLYSEVGEVSERLGAGGEVLQPLQIHQAREHLQAAYDKGIRSVAIVLMHAYRFPEHEQKLAELAREIGFTQVSASHEVSPLVKLVGRGDTTVVDAYLSPILRRYVDQVAGELGEVRLQFMQSNGGLTDAQLFQGKDAILSGPAGGIVAATRTAQAQGFQEVITFDMGGTSTDVAHYAGKPEVAFETEVAGVRIRAPMMKIHTVAAGGGSICSFDGARFRVGPESAGANPGPRSYRRGGPLAVTDCNVMLGRLQSGLFPPVFGPDQDQPLDTQAVQQAFSELADEVNAALPSSEGEAVKSPEEVAFGFLQIAVLQMANAIKKISVQQGYDVTSYTLVSFGGAGGQHACMVADALGMESVYLHPLAGVLSAYGMGLADIAALREATVEEELVQENMPDVTHMLDQLGEEAVAAVLKQQVPRDQIKVNKNLLLRYQGTDSTLEVELNEDAEAMRAEFHSLYATQFGFSSPGKTVIVATAAVEAIGSTARAQGADNGNTHQGKGTQGHVEKKAPVPLSTVKAYFGDEWLDTQVYQREELAPGSKVSGPAILSEAVGTTVVDPGWAAHVTDDLSLVLTRIVPLERQVAIGTNCDPVYLEVFNNLFMSIAEQMGFTLQNTSSSVNIKERLDFSCAIFDSQGQLIANAPHMPVHLGSMGESVRVVIQRNQDTMQPGDVFVLNDPYNGGTHLPDVTVVTPVYSEDEPDRVLFYVGSRGHQADIGGTSPASMPPGSTHISEEGVLIDNFKLVAQGGLREQAFRDLLASGDFPARNPDTNIADIQAQIASNNQGITELRKMVRQFGLDTVTAYMNHVQDNAEEEVRRAISVFSSSEFEYKMDNGALVKVRITIDPVDRSAEVDFSGSSAQLTSNFNAPSAIVRAATMYVFRTLVNDDIPMNEGCLKPIKLIVPAGSLLNPEFPAAVVAGNVETSQVVTDTLYGALQVMAASQGTMNNVTFGNSNHQYYETVCGGQGAGPGFDGTDAVHTHMTNSRLTDPEILETRYPVLLEEFSIRRGSGGKGKFKGGDGITRRIRFLEDMQVNILSNRRIVPPYGMDGGEAGECGRSSILRQGCTDEEDLASCDGSNVKVGDVFILRTPSGGGFGSAD